MQAVDPDQPGRRDRVHGRAHLARVRGACAGEQREGARCCHRDNCAVGVHARARRGHSSWRRRGGGGRADHGPPFPRHYLSTYVTARGRSVKTKFAKAAADNTPADASTKTRRHSGNGVPGHRPPWAIHGRFAARVRVRSQKPGLALSNPLSSFNFLHTAAGVRVNRAHPVLALERLVQTTPEATSTRVLNQPCQARRC